ncbi:MAG: hypothetical protein VB141_10975 [Burkholderia gladioli]
MRLIVGWVVATGVLLSASSAQAADNQRCGNIASLYLAVAEFRDEGHSPQNAYKFTNWRSPGITDSDRKKAVNRLYFESPWTSMTGLRASTVANNECLTGDSSQWNKLK